MIFSPVQRIARFLSGPCGLAHAVALLGCGALAWALALPATAQPTAEPITVIVPYSQNGPTDRTMRALAKPLSQALGGTPITVKNVPSPGGVQGLADVANAKPDGRTLLFTNTNIALLPALGDKLPFDPNTAFSYLGLMLESPMVILGRPTLEPKTAREFADWLERTDSSQIRLADAGAGSASYLCGLFLQSLAGKSFTRVEFPGSAPALTALKENKVDVLCDQTPSVKAPLLAKTVQGYAQTTGTPMTGAPFSSLVTLRRMFSRELELSIWHGFYGPKGLPPDVQARLNTAIRQAAADPVFVADQQAQGVIMIGGRRLTPEGHKAFIDETVPLWQLIVSISKSRQK